MVLLMLLALLIQTNQESETYRVNLDQAYQSADFADALYEKMRMNEALSPVGMAYLATLEMIMADNAVAPWSKLSHFNQGAELLDEAVKKDVENIEIRYLRFACQTKSPDFLGYDEHIKEDKTFIIARFRELKDQDLKRRIQKIVKESKHITEEERKMFL